MVHRNIPLCDKMPQGNILCQQRIFMSDGMDILRHITDNYLYICKMMVVRKTI
jgi:hypothetical protein